MPFSRSVPPKKKTTTFVIFGSALALIVALAVVGLVTRQLQPEVREINSTGQLRELAQTGAARSVLVSGEVVTVTQANGQMVRAVVTNAVAQHEVVTAFEKGGATVAYETQQPGLLLNILNYLLPTAALLIFAFIGWRVYASMGGQNEPVASEANPANPVTFQDVAGVDEARTELSETIEFLRDPEKFGRLGGRAPRGILLSGPPGTGKTLLARAAARRGGRAFPLGLRFELSGEVRRPRRGARPPALREARASSRPASSSSTRSTRSAVSAVAAATRPRPIRIRRSTSCSSRWTASSS